MKKITLSFFFIINAFCLFAQTNYYIDQQNGDDTNNGLSTTTAFESTTPVELYNSISFFKFIF